MKNKINELSKRENANESKKNKLKEFYSRVKNRKVFYLVLLVVILVLLHFLLKLFNLQFRQWVYEIAGVILAIAISIPIIQEFNDPNSKMGKIMWYAGAILTFLCVRIACIILLLISNMPNASMTEHVVERNECKYVANVDVGFLRTTVYFHEYVNFFVMGSESKFQESYRGSYDPIAREKEKSNDVSNKKEAEIIEKFKIQEVDTDDILYEKRIMMHISIRVVNAGNVLGGKKIIKIQRTTNGGYTWKDQIETEDKTITINDKAKFVFIDENIGFINNLSLIGTDKQNNGLLVTTNGGKSFENATIVPSSNIEDSVFYVSDIPYIENGELKVKLYSLSNKTVYNEFYSEDNGLTWKYKE